MPEPNDDKLKKLFDEFEERKRTEHEQGLDRDAKEKAIRDQASATFRDVALPVVKAIAASTIDAGHVAIVTERLDGMVHPHIELKFTPKALDQSMRHISASTLTLIFAKSGEIEAKREVMTGQGRAPSHNIPGALNSRIAMEKLSATWVEQQCISFIGAVLNAN
jgi:hypothetical protein